MNRDISDVRHDYHGDTLCCEDAPSTPFPLFSRWLEQALESDPEHANAMTLASVDERGFPHARVVLLKGFDEQGMVFYTNYKSHKGIELTTTGHAALVFWWPQLARQVRVEGDVEKVDSAQSDRYFAARPKESQLAAWASSQSTVISGREELTVRLSKLRQRFAEQPIERPAHWGGFRLRPTMIEFWQGQPSRLHDRLRYTQRADSDNSGNAWQCAQLAP
ncbi:Pyridoxine/pyridoxamine 5'-phosphate oxidase [Carnimonas sp. R-84981]|uniref:pyridoxamine 5'-phosphate oxidase n=1 Tax=Carnimonas bestiolae TaxID=3402172 RepID=UPI003EDBC5C5